jgi:hypothetical protein
MRKIMGMWLVTALMVLGCGLAPLHAQEDKKPSSEDVKAQPERGSASGLPGIPGAPGNKPVHPYRVDFLINELDGEKKINARRYSMILTSGDRNQVKIGTRVPVSSTPSFQYLDVGTAINCRLSESGDDLVLDVHSDFSSLAGPEEQHSSQPIVRQFDINGSTLVVLGKPIVIGAMDDPNSNRTFQLEATVTRLK